MRKGREGFTILELLIAVSLMVMLTGVAVYVFTQAVDIFVRVDSASQIYQNGRVALDILQREVMSGVPLRTSDDQGRGQYFEIYGKRDTTRTAPEDVYDFSYLILKTTVTKYDAATSANAVVTAFVRYSVLDPDDDGRGTLIREVWDETSDVWGDRAELCRVVTRFLIEYATEVSGTLDPGTSSDLLDDVIVDIPYAFYFPGEATWIDVDGDDNRDTGENYWGYWGDGSDTWPPTNVYYDGSGGATDGSYRYFWTIHGNAASGATLTIDSIVTTDTIGSTGAPISSPSATDLTTDNFWVPAHHDASVTGPAWVTASPFERGHDQRGPLPLALKITLRIEDEQSREERTMIRHIWIPYGG